MRSPYTKHGLILTVIDMYQARKWRYSVEKAELVAVSSMFIYNVMVVLVMDIRGICYYKILLEK